MNKKNRLSKYLKIKRRYTRSVNLERDLELSDSILGYVLTPKTIEIIKRLFESFNTLNTNRSWTLTGVYGTGKSAFAHFLTALCASSDNKIRKNALNILSNSINGDTEFFHNIENKLPDRGFIRAVATAQHEPIGNTIIRALYRGATTFWSKRKPSIFTKLSREYKKITNKKDYKSDEKIVLRLIYETARSAKTGLLIVIDELGKNLEFSVQSQSVSDLYILQQIAELPSGQVNPKIYLLGILHQSFADYTHSLIAEQKNEWAKIQGRFEDIIFTESYDQLIRVIKNALEHHFPKSILTSIDRWAKDWILSFKGNKLFTNIDQETISSIYPLHPIAAVILPILCNKFAQNDRTLFTFLASPETHSLTSFLHDNYFYNKNIPTLKTHHIYDYFVETAAGTISLRPEFQRWTEIQNRITEAQHLDQDSLLVLKTIGVLNLISVSGSLRASRNLVTTALCNRYQNTKERHKWNKTIGKLMEQGLLIWRKQADELRIWEGSDFDIEHHVKEKSHKFNVSFAELLAKNYSLNYVVAQRHSYETGTLRYFEQCFFDENQDISKLKTSEIDSDGIICYWTGKPKEARNMPFKTNNGKPIIVLIPKDIKTLKMACQEYVALKEIERDSSHLRHDGVARREVRQRLAIAKSFLDKSISQVFDISSDNITCLINGKKEKFSNRRSFNTRLSKICDTVYSQSLRLNNEFINRQVLSGQITKARKDLIEAMLLRGEKNRLGFSGHGPETSLYDSLLSKTGIHSYNPSSDSARFYKPKDSNGALSIWNAVEEFCLSATESQKPLNELYDKLIKPPYGVKKPVILIFLAAILIKNSSKFGIYRNGSFMPSLSSEDFVIIEKKPETFTVKHFALRGLRTQIFNEFEKMFVRSGQTKSFLKKKPSLLGLVTPLIRFAKNLPNYTINTKNLSKRALAVRRALLEVREPDKLLFVELPKAFGLSSIKIKEKLNERKAYQLRKKLEGVLRELHLCYDYLISKCTNLLCEAFDIPHENRIDLRAELMRRSRGIIHMCVEPKLKQFMTVVKEKNEDHRAWLESLLVVISEIPTKFWSDDDLKEFELNLADIARRFKNIERFRKKKLNINDKDYYARTIILTQPNGEELYKTFWVKRKKYNAIEKKVNNILSAQPFKGNKKLKQVLLSVLAEEILEKNK